MTTEAINIVLTPTCCAATATSARFEGSNLQIHGNGDVVAAGWFGHECHPADPLQRAEGPPGTEVEVRHVAVIEADRDQPWLAGRTLAELVDGQKQFLVLIALWPDPAGSREARNER